MNSALTEHETLTSLVSEIKRRGLATPVALLTEMHLPLASITGAVAISFQPLLSIFLGRERMEQLLWLFEDRARLERFSELLLKEK